MNRSALERASSAEPMAPEERLRLNHVAGEWFVRQQQAQWSLTDVKELDEWLHSDPKHQAAFERVGQAWTDAAQLQSLQVQAAGGRRAATDGPRGLGVHRSQSGSGRTATLGAWLRWPSLGAAMAVALLLSALSGGYGWYQWQHVPLYQLNLATRAGEVRSMDLPDGSRIDLNTASILQVRYFRNRREVVLEQGEAFFRVAPDTGKPFTVDSGASRVRVLGTAFNVRAEPPTLVVQVQHGRVEVWKDRTQGRAHALVLGAGAGVAVHAADSRHRPVATVADAVGEWRSGQIYLKRTPLAEVARELSRYLGAPVVVEGDHQAQIPVSGLVALREPERFLQALPSLIDVRVEQQSDGSWRIRQP